MKLTVEESDSQVVCHGMLFQCRYSSLEQNYDWNKVLGTLDRREASVDKLILT